MSTKKNALQFGRKYDLFLSEASNEEIVSISKELLDVFDARLRSINLNALTLMGISMVSMILSISLVSDLSTALSGSTKNIIFLMRMIAIAFMGLTLLVSYLALQKVSQAIAYAPLYWKNVRETATDESAYQHSDSIRTIDFMAGSAKNLNLVATLTLVIAGLSLAVSYIFQMMAASGYF